MASLTERMMGAARLDVATYTEVENDQTATSQAMLVVAISSVAAGIGAGGGGVMAVIWTTVASLIGWAAWAFVTYFVGTKLLAEPQTKADWGELLRTIGFASAPGVLRVFGIIPVVGTVIAFAASVWMLVAMVIAVREALDYESTGRAVAVCLVGFMVYMFIAIGLGLMMGVAGAVAGAVGG